MFLVDRNLNRFIYRLKLEKYFDENTEMILYELAADDVAETKLKFSEDEWEKVMNTVKHLHDSM